MEVPTAAKSTGVRTMNPVEAFLQEKTAGVAGEVAEKAPGFLGSLWKYLLLLLFLVCFLLARKCIASRDLFLLRKLGIVLCRKPCLFLRHFLVAKTLFLRVLLRGRVLSFL